jgi:metal-sulfur cluster biosynthetic enzyme
MSGGMTRAACAPAAQADAGTRDRVLAALDGVIDPELDESITSLRFLSRCEVSADGDVEIGLRLPTPQCAPNFAFLMAADARKAVHGLPGVRGVVVRLEDHYTGLEINAALGRGEGFTGAFPGETDDDDLQDLRELFQRKALVARQSLICEAWLKDGLTAEEVCARRVVELPDSLEGRRCVALRTALRLETGLESPAFVSPSGQPIVAGELVRWLRMARLIRTSLEANGGICRSLLKVRHDLETDVEEIAR